MAQQQDSREQNPHAVDRASDHPIGPTSIQGLEASESGDERGNVDTDPRKVVARKMPQNTGGQPDGEVGLRALPDSADAADHGHV
jgi:hypothetical protein